MYKLNQGKEKQPALGWMKKEQVAFLSRSPNGNRLLKKRTEKNLRDNALLL